MRARSRNFLEDISVFVVLGILIYAIYSYFFSTPEYVPLENKTVIEKKVELNQDEKEIKVEEEISQKENVKENEDLTIKENQPNEVINKETPSEIEKVEVIEDVKSPESTEEQTAQVNSNETIELFYKDIENKINTNISKNLNKKTLDSLGEINIRITILKDGKYEQLTLMSGDKNSFDSIKSSVLKVFPLTMPENLKENFPRYFRMKVEH